MPQMFRLMADGTSITDATPKLRGFGSGRSGDPQAPLSRRYLCHLCHLWKNNDPIALAIVASTDLARLLSPPPMPTKPSIPKGTRDFGPQEMLRRKWIFSTIERVFQKYGFLPLETPAMENLETLTGKYGEEGDRLIFKILNSGDAWKEVNANVKEALTKGEAVHPGRLASELSEKALRYDLTVPFARYVVQHQHELTFPFKRYQIQPVWRADRPQKGRYREFYQCDVDVIGSQSLLNELELVSIIAEIFTALDLRVYARMNSRKIIQGMVEMFGATERPFDLVATLDKLDKIEVEGVISELRKDNFSVDVVSKVEVFFSEMGPLEPEARHERLEELFHKNSIAIGLEGSKEVRFIQDQLRDHFPPGFIDGRFDPFLARGLNYYTGLIFEVSASEGSLQSSICGGGRYDNLTGVFGLEGMSGVGISFGADRIYDVLLELDRFPKDLATSTKLFFVNFGEQEQAHCLKLLRTVRDAGISAELYPDAGAKMKKQMGYADAKGIPFVAIVGENELKHTPPIVTVKDMKSGEQKAVKQDELIAMLLKAESR